MGIHSTSKMLAKMIGKVNFESPVIAADDELDEIFTAPQLRPSSDMGEVLSNILGPSSPVKKHTPTG